jgi:hypothetical protein
MIPTEKTELFDIALLRVLDANNTLWGLQAQALGMFTREFGFSPSTSETVNRLEYLTGKGMVEDVAKVLSKANRAWKITSTGRRYLDEQGF